MRFFLDGLGEEVVVTVEPIAGRVRTVALHVPLTNTLLVDGVWAHNDTGLTQLTSTSSSSSSSSSSTPTKSSGSSFSSSLAPDRPVDPDERHEGAAASA